jgi:hypothetical protein
LGHFFDAVTFLKILHKDILISKKYV